MEVNFTAGDCCEINALHFSICIYSFSTNTEQVLFWFEELGMF